MKIPFTLDAWLNDKSQKIETRDGRTARIICTDAKADDGACIIALIPGYGGEEAYQFFPDGRAFSSKSSNEDCADLFIVTPEEELTEFEKQIENLLNLALPEGHAGTTIENTKRVAADLLAVARKELTINLRKHFEERNQGDTTLQDLLSYKEGFDIGKEEGKAEALKEIEQDPESSYAFKRGVEYGKEEALNDLPRWIDDGLPTGSAAIDISGLCGYDFIRRRGRLVRISDLEKLPGFND